MTVTAVIAAGGVARRMGGVNKQLMLIAGKPVLAHTLNAFESHPVVDNVVIVTRGEATDEVRQLVAENGFEKVVAYAPAGRERQDSVWSGIQACPKETEIVCVHNGANPLVTPEEITACVEAAKKHGAAVVAVRVKDTIRVVDGQMFSVKTLDRKELWAMQTPQCICFDLAKRAFEKAFADGFYGTDDVQLVERLGEKVKVVEGSYENFKITTPEDALSAEKILSARQAK